MLTAREAVRLILEADEPCVTTVTSVGVSGGNFEGQAVVSWQLDYENRKWGVKGLSVKVTRVAVTGSVTFVNDGDHDASKQLAVVWDAAQDEDNDWELKVQTIGVCLPKDSLAPQRIELNLPAKTVEVSF